MRQQNGYMTSTCVRLLESLEEPKRITIFKVARLAGEEGTPLLLLGAFARDILFWHMHRIEPGRRTEDVDISIQLPDWAAYDAFARRLHGAGFTSPDASHPEKLLDTVTRQEVDLLPFGEIADNGRTIVWREDNSPWSVVGLQDAFEHSLQLPVESDGIRCEIPMVTAPALVMLKVVAFHDRPEARSNRDGTDVGFVIRRYLDIGNRARLANSDADIMDRTGDDIDLASAMLLGRDIKSMCSEETREYVLGILEREVASGSRCPLVRGLARGFEGEFARARSLLALLAEGMKPASR